MALQGRLYAIAKQEQDIDTSTLFRSMMTRVDSTGAVVIDGRSIAAESIYAYQLHAESITADKIKAGEIVGDHIAGGTITTDKLETDSVLLPGKDYGGVILTSSGMDINSTGARITLSGSSGLVVHSKVLNADTLKVDPATGQIEMNVTSLNVASKRVVTEDELEEKINEVEAMPGPSAFEVAVENGYSGTESQWLASLKGPEGPEGIPGQPGPNGQTSYFHTAWANNATGTSGFSTTVSANKLYMGTYSNFTQQSSSNPSDYTWVLVKGEQGPQGPQGIQGPTGTNGTSQYVYIRYSANANGSSMTTTPNSTSKYIGLVNTTSSTAPTSNTAYTWSLIKGEDGSPGIQGPKGDNGEPTFTWVRYADDVTGKNMSDSPYNKKYIGLAFNKATATESNIPDDYQWSAMFDERAFAGVSLNDKDTQSGTELYTDKADDSVVHLNIDGKSYQNAGSGENRIPHLEHWTLSGGAYVENNVLHITPTGSATVQYDWVGTESQQVYGFDIVRGPRIYASTEYRDRQGNLITNAGGVHTGNGFEGDTVEGTRRLVYFPVLRAETARVRLRLSGHSTHAPDGFAVKNIAFSTTSENVYEPPQQTPEYPIAIESVNDLELVSGAGKSNLYPNSADFTSSTNWSNTTVVQKDGFTVIEGQGGVTASGRTTVPIKSNTTYVYTVEIMFDKDTTIGATSPVHHQFADGSNLHAGQYARLSDGTAKAKEWTKVVIRAHSRSAKTFRPHIHGLSSETKYWIKSIKLEEGDSVTPWVPEIGDIVYDTYTPKLYKTKLSLSEPLRSVEDVHDRLFRDADGLWKVERNIAEHKFSGNENWIVHANYSNSTTDVFECQLQPSLSNALTSASTSGYLPTNSNQFKSTLEMAPGTNEIRIGKTENGTWIPVGLPKNMFTVATWKAHLASNPLVLEYIRSSKIDTLPESDQVKLNNIASYAGDNYVYTLIGEHRKPVLHGTFKGGGWNNRRVNLEDIKNSISFSKDQLAVEKKRFDRQFTEVHDNSSLTGTVKTQLSAAKTQLNTAYSNLIISIDTVILNDGHVTHAAKNAVADAFNTYAARVEDYEARINQAMQSISDRKISTSFDLTNEQIDLRVSDMSNPIMVKDLPRINANGGMLSSAAGNYLQITEDILLGRCEVLSNYNGNLTVQVRIGHGTAGTITETRSFPVTTGSNWINLNILLKKDVATNYTLMTPTSNGLFRTNHPVSYPIDAGSFKITGNNAGSPASFYYYFYNLHVSGKGIIGEEYGTGRDNILARLNLSQEGARIQGDKIQLTGNTQVDGNFKVTGGNISAGIIRSNNGVSELNLDSGTFNFGSGRLVWNGSSLSINANSLSRNNSTLSTQDEAKGYAETEVNKLEIGGRNLLNGTSKEMVAYGFNSWNEYPYGRFDFPHAGEVITASAYLQSTGQPCAIRVFTYNSAGARTESPDSNWIQSNGEGRVSLTWTIPTNAVRAEFVLRHNSGTAPMHTVRFKEAQIELGNKRTAWNKSLEDFESYSVGMGRQVMVPGQPNIYSGAGYLSNAHGQYIIISEDILVGKTLIDADRNGSIIVQIRAGHGATGTVLQEKTFSVIQGKQWLDLNFLLKRDEGTNYTLMSPSGTVMLYRHNGGASYPMDAGSFRMTRATHDTVSFYYFYNLHVSGRGVVGEEYINNVLTNTKDITDSWTFSNSTTIDGGRIESGTVSAQALLVGGGNVSTSNLAAGRSLTGNGTGTTATNGNKKIGDTFQSFGSGNSTNNNTEGAYIQVDLGSVHKIAQSQIYFFSGDGRHYWYKIKYSHDGTNWSYAVGGPTNNGWVTSIPRKTGATVNPTINNFPFTITARYVRLFANGNTSNTSNHIYEWELFSTPQTRILGDQIETGLLRSENGVSEIDLASGTFSFGDGSLVFDGDTLSVNADNVVGTQQYLDLRDSVTELETVTQVSQDELSELMSTMNEYMAFLEQNEEALDTAVTEIADLLQRVPAIENNLGGFVEQWTFLDTYMRAGDEGLIIQERNGSTGIRITHNRIDFLDGSGEPVAYITNQVMRINRGIFVDSAQIGEHKIETLSGGHTVFTWVN